MDIRFRDHSSFHRAAAGMVGGAVLCGLALTAAKAPLAPLAGGVLGIGAGAALAYGSRWRMILAVLAAVPLLALTPTWPALAASGAVLALALAIGGPRGLLGLAGVALGALTTLVAMWCALRIGTARETAGWPHLATAAAGSAAMGIVGMLAMLPRHVSFTFDPVRAAIRRLPTGLDAEVRQLCERSVAIWAGAKDRMADEGGAQLLREGVLKTLEVAGKSAIHVAGPTETELAARMTDLDARIAAATDAEVKTQYQSARAALDDQQRYRDRIRQGRERLVARMHNHVAALEKFQLAATGLESARAVAAGAPAVAQLEALSHDVAASGEALAEVELASA